MSFTVIPTESIVRTPAKAVCAKNTHSARSASMKLDRTGHLTGLQWPLLLARKLLRHPVADPQPPCVDRERGVHPTRSRQDAAVHDVQAVHAMHASTRIDH